MFEKLGVVAVTHWVVELLAPTKAAYPLMSESGAEYSWEGLTDDLKKALLGMMAVNDLSESSSVGVTVQLKVFGWIGMANAAAISDMARNGFLDRPTTKKEMSSSKTSLFIGLLEELQLTVIMTVVEEAPTTRQSNTDALERNSE